jgi:hypothetical protein
MATVSSIAFNKMNRIISGIFLHSVKAIPCNFIRDPVCRNVYNFCGYFHYTAMSLFISLCNEKSGEANEKQQ